MYWLLAKRGSTLVSGFTRWKRSPTTFFADFGVPSGSAEALRFLEATGAASGELRPTVAVDEEEDLRSKGLLVLVFFAFLSESESESDEEESLDDELEPLLEDTDAAFLAFFVTAFTFDFFAGFASESLSELELELESLDKSEELEDEEETEAAFLLFLATGLALVALVSESLSESLEDESELLESLEASDSGRAVFLAALRLSSLSESLEDEESDDEESEDGEAAFAALADLVFFAGGAFSASDSESELELDESELDSASFTGAFFVTFFAFFTGFLSSASDSLLEALLESELESLLESLLASLSSTSMGSGASLAVDSTPFARAVCSHSANILARSGYPLAACLTALSSVFASSDLATSVYPFAFRKERTRSRRGAGA
jgi:hypothetical protein